MSERVAAAPFPWPDALPGLGPRRVAPFTRCVDCRPGIEKVFLPGLDPDAGERIWVPTPVPTRRGTFVAYAHVPFCLAHARLRARINGFDPTLKEEKS